MCERLGSRRQPFAQRRRQRLDQRELCVNGGGRRIEILAGGDRQAGSIDDLRIEQMQKGLALSLRLFRRAGQFAPQRRVRLGEGVNVAPGRGDAPIGQGGERLQF